MPNQLSIPFKKTYVIQIRQAAKAYILSNYTDVHPDAFKWDINQWESLRKDVVGDAVHLDRIKSFLRYHAQLVFILTKLPNDIGLEIPYAPAFEPSALPVTLPNLTYERAAVLFNTAALYSQLASAENRSNPHGLKHAITYYQHAAGTLNHLNSSAIQKLRASVTEADMPLEFSQPFVGSLELLMLAQAQECVWQRAVLDHYTNGTIAKLATKASTLYGDCLSVIRGASPSIKHLFPSNWISHLETKQLHFDSAAQFRKSVEDLEANRYGDEISRLKQAQTLAKKGYDTARRGNVTSAVLQDIKSILDNVQKSLTRAERDNDLIYHQEVPPPSALSPIQEASIAKSAVPVELTDPKSLIGQDVIFGELLGWGARTAIDIYQDRRQSWLKEEVTDRAQKLNDVATETLRSLNLPSALEALEKPIGLPPSLLKKADEVRSEDGPARVEASIEDVKKLAKRDMEILDEALDILDQEADEDEIFQAEHPSERLPSQVANGELSDKAHRYRSILDQAGESDAVVRRKWDDWEGNIVELTWNESDLEASIPSSTVSLSHRTSSGPNTTLSHARALRVLLESLDESQRARTQLVARATRLADAEDIAPRILKAAAGLERWTEVQPAMFEDVLDEELAKYEKFREELLESEQKQEELLISIRERNVLFLQSRKTDATVKEREHALQSLDLAYHKYREITRNLDEGLKFYNDFAEILTQFRAACKEWVSTRRDEMHALSQSMQAVSLDSPPLIASAPPAQRDTQQPPDSRRRSDFRVALDLPPPDSDQWEAIDLPPAPTIPMKKSSRRA